VDFMTLWESWRLAGGLMAGLSGLCGLGAHLFAQATAPSGQLEGLATSIGTGSVLVGGSGILIAISTLLKPYWDDRQKQRDFEERKLRITTSLQRNNWLTKEMYDVLVKAHKCVPNFPEPPDWIALQDVSDQERTTR
jgi:hypothetical protein